MRKSVYYDFNEAEVRQALILLLRRNDKEFGSDNLELEPIFTNSARGITPPKKVFSGVRVKIYE